MRQSTVIVLLRLTREAPLLDDCFIYVNENVGSSHRLEETSIPDEKRASVSCVYAGHEVTKSGSRFAKLQRWGNRLLDKPYDSNRCKAASPPTYSAIHPFACFVEPLIDT